MKNERIIEVHHSKNNKMVKSVTFLNKLTDVSECGKVYAVICLKPGYMTTKLLALLESTYGFVFNSPEKIEHKILLPIYKSIAHTELFETVTVLKNTVNEFSCDLLHWSVTVS